MFPPGHFLEYHLALPNLNPQIHHPETLPRFFGLALLTFSYQCATKPDNFNRNKPENQTNK
jgi:hypothetical protein